MKLFLALIGVTSAYGAVPAALCAASAWLSFEAYDLLFGHACAVGLIVSLFSHEAGHIIAARIVGVRASLPYFLPMLGAVICLKRRVRDARYEAAIALGGPALGSLSACLFLALYLWSGERMYLLWSYLAAWLNLFNLIPCYPLDGGRIGSAVSRYAWCVGMVLMVICLWVWKQILFLLLIIGALYRCYRGEQVQAICLSWRLWILGCYLLLCILLGGLTMMIELLLNR